MVCPVRAAFLQNCPRGARLLGDDHGLWRKDGGEGDADNAEPEVHQEYLYERAYSSWKMCWTGYTLDAYHGRGHHCREAV